MSMRKHGRFGRTITAAVVTTLAVSGQALSATSADALNQASALLEQGRLVEARRTVASLDRETLPQADRDRAMDLLVAIDRRMRFADPLEISLEKADLALADGDVREAMRQGTAALRAENATPEQKTRASAILDRAEVLRAELAPLAHSALAQAVTDLHNGLYAEAKAGFDSVYRSGASLAPSELRTLDRSRERIAALERTRGEAFEVQYVPMSMLDPGRVTRNSGGEPSRSEPRPETSGSKDFAPASLDDQPGTTRRNQPTWDEPAPAEEPAPDDDLAGALTVADDDQQSDAATQNTQQSDEAIREALRFEAQRILAEADAAFAAGRYNEALQKYGQAASVYRQYLPAEEVQRASNRAAETRVLLEQPGGPGAVGGDAPIDEIIQTRTVLLEQARAEFANSMSEAEKALQAGDIERARNLAAEARLRLAEARDVFPEQEYEGLVAQQENLLSRIRLAEESIRSTEAESRSKALEQAAAEQERARRAERDAKIRENLDRIRALQMERRYKEALQVVDQVLFLDPNNPAALLLRDAIQDVIVYQDWGNAQRAKHLGIAIESNEMQKGMVIPQDILEYPADWPEISFRRGEPAAYVESDADRRVLAELDTKRIPASFADNTLEDVIEFIRTVTNVNLDPDWESLRDIGVDRDTLVTLNLQPLPARIVLDRVLEKVSPDAFSRAGWAVNDGILVVASEEALRKNTFIVLYDVRDLLFQIPDYREVPELNLNAVVRQSGGGGGGGIFQQAGQQVGEGLTIEELQERLIEIIQTNVDFDGWRDNGGDTGQLQDLNGNLIITNTAKNHREINALLRKLREIRAIQVSVEARFLTVSQDFFEQIGFDVDIVFNAMNSQFDSVQQQWAAYTGVQNAGGAGFNLLPSDLVGPFFTGDRTGGVRNWVWTNQQEVFDDPNTLPTYAIPTSADPNFPGFVVPAPDGWSQIPVQQNSLGLADALFNGTTFGSTILNSNPALAIAGTFLDDIQVDFLVEATQADSRSVTLTAPRLTFTNGRYANIFVNTQQSYVSDLNPVVGTSSVAFDPEVEVVNSGFTLLIGGVVSSDRRYVTMDIQLAVAQVVGFDQATVSAQAGGTGGSQSSGDLVSSSFDLPIVQVSSVSTGATVPDQGTILLGGQRLTTETEVETGVPVLSKIPILNRFFTNRIEEKNEQTLLILLKPTILIQNEEEEKNFPGLLDSLRNRLDAGF